MLGYQYKRVNENKYYHIIDLFQSQTIYKLVLFLLILFLIAGMLLFVYLSIKFYSIITNKILNLQLTSNFVYYLVSINLIITAFQGVIQEMINGNSALFFYLYPLILLSVTIIFILLHKQKKKIFASLILSMLFYIMNVSIPLILF
ncbi:hypothetical protein CEQ21_01175 [Niallia circulans]|uniref:Uncharacterized protein n=1 Tax=Niallia circulans TaxID=1397 RepID=A0A553SRI7_NIACI|nr:hypothetical protein CEQ21_01175 [Niallia circulans]